MGSVTLSGEKSSLREMEMLGGMQQYVVGEELGSADLAGDAISSCVGEGTPREN